MSRRRFDPAEERARKDLLAFLGDHKEEVSFSRQLEVIHEDDHFHWISNRALRQMVSEGILKDEVRQLDTGAEIHLLWHRNYRYYKRRAKQLLALVNRYAAPNVAAAVGLQGEALVLDGFARNRFVLQGRHTREFKGRSWSKTGHTGFHLRA